MSFFSDLIEEISSHDIEDEESSPVDVHTAKSSSYNIASTARNTTSTRNRRHPPNAQQQNNTLDDENDMVNRNIAAPITPSTTAGDDVQQGKHNSSVKSTSSASASNEPEGDVVGQIDQFVMQPAQQGVLYKCRITRDRKGMDRGLFPIYYLHLERDYGKKIFLLGGELIESNKFRFLAFHKATSLGRKRKKSKTSNYIISCDPTDLSRQADGFCGKLRSNVFGTSFTVYDSGSKDDPESHRLDLAAIIYVRHFFIIFLNIA